MRQRSTKARSADSARGLTLTSWSRLELRRGKVERNGGVAQTRLTQTVVSQVEMPRARVSPSSAGASTCVPET